MRREGDRRLIIEVLLETRGRTEMRLLEPGASPAGLLDLLQRHAVPGDLVTLVHVGDTWTASTLTREWPFDEAMAANLLADRSPTVVERAESRVVQLGVAGNLAVVSGASGSRQRFPNWIFGMTRRPASLVVGWTTRDGSPRLLTFSRSPDFLAAVDGGDAPGNEPVERRVVVAEVLARRVPNRSVVYRFQLARPLVRRSRSDDPVAASAATPVEEEGVAP
jgi:hypothetical protein